MSKAVRIWIIVSLVVLGLGYFLPLLGMENGYTITMYIIGGISSLLAIGYYSTPSGSIYGKVIYGCVILMVLGMILKILHYVGANECIEIGLVGLIATYLLMWFRERKLKQRG